MRTLPLVLSLILGVGCASTPLGFKGGTNWRIPMVGPLEPNAVVVPAMIHGKGPYLFLLDPDASMSAIDTEVATELKLYTPGHTNVLNENDQVTPMPVFEVLEASFGELEVEKVTMAGVRPGTLWVGGRRIHGYLGGDLLSRSIVIDVDRDSGTVHLALVGHETIPEGATRIDGHLFRSAATRSTGGTGVTVVMVKTAINGVSGFDMAVDLAATMTAVYPSRIGKANVAFDPSQEVVIDHTGAMKRLSGRTQVRSMTLGKDTQVPDVTVIAWDDKRFRDNEIQGAIGQNLLSRFRVQVNRDEPFVYLAPRQDDLGTGAAARFARWPEMAACTDPGCAKAFLVKPNAEGETHRAVVIRDTALKTPRYEAVLQALDDTGAPIDAPLLRIAMEEGINKATVPISDRYATANGFRVVDASPHPPACQPRVCVDAIQ